MLTEKLKKNIYILFLFLFVVVKVITLQAQNLVPNPSFEIFDTCPNSVTQLKYAVPWFQPSIGTPDFFNECFDFSNPWYANVDVPNNFLGFQYAKQGGGYAGMIAFEYYPGIPYREYIEARLIQPLQAGMKYYVFFYLSLADSAGYATDDIGVYFSADSITCDSCFYLPYTPQIENPHGNFLTDKTNWMLFFDTYIAQGDEQFITIGNFTDEANCDTLFIGGGLPSSEVAWEVYYYIDDIYVGTENPLLINNITLGEIKVSPNPVKDILTIVNKNNSTNEIIISIFNINGQLIMSNKLQNENSIELDVSKLAKGIYILKLQIENETENRKLIIQ